MVPDTHLAFKIVLKPVDTRRWVIRDAHVSYTKTEYAHGVRLLAVLVILEVLLLRCVKTPHLI